MARKKAENKKKPQIYTYEQLQKLEDHIEKYFGGIRNYLQETETDDIRLNIYSLPPDINNRCLTLVTAGMGAVEMQLPENVNRKDITRCELILSLSPDWNIQGEELEDCWPLHLLKLLSRLPIREKSWLGCYHTVDYGTTFASNVGFTSVMIMPASDDEKACVCELPDGETVNFYRVFPLYKSELDFKCLNGSDALLDKFGKNYSFITEIERPPVVREDFLNVVDTVREHSAKIEDKALDLKSICGANHIAAYLRWIIEKNMLDDDFVDFFEEELDAIHCGKLDIRKFLINSLDGELLLDMMNEEGAEFTKYYYGFYRCFDEPCYPGDVDDMALEYFGEEKYNCKGFADEAYLFVPYDEDYFVAMRKYIDKRYDEFRKRSRTE